MREATGDTFDTVLRLFLLSLLVAAAWLTLSLAMSTSSASAHGSAGLLGPDSSDSSHETSSPVRDILNGVTEPLAPIAETVDHTLPAPLSDAVALVTSLPTGTAIDELTGTLGDLAGTLDGLASDVIGLVSDTAVEVLPDTLAGLLGGITNDTLEVLVPDGLDVVGANASTPKPADHSLRATAVTVHPFAEVLSPLAPALRPWSPGNLMLINAGAFSASGTGGAAPAGSDLPSFDNWLSAESSHLARAPDDDVPSSPTFDTDSTPD